MRVKVGFNLYLRKFSDLLPQTTPWHESVPHISELAGESHKVAALSRRQTSVRICHKRYNEVRSRLPEGRESGERETQREKRQREGKRVTVTALSALAQCVASAAFDLRAARRRLPARIQE